MPPVYVTVAEVRAEGVPKSVPDARITSRINKWEAITEQVTNNVFRSISPGEIRFDGNDADIMHFSLPLISVSSLRINEETVAMDTSDYIAYTGASKPQDDRKNPKIRLRPTRETIFRRNSSLFIKGLDQFVTADWGYLEGGVTPQPIKAAIIKLVVLDLDGYFDSSSATIPTTGVRRERTDGHEIEYQQVQDARTVWNSIPSDVADILAMFRSPWAIAVPSPPRFSLAVSLGISIFAD